MVAAAAATSFPRGRKPKASVQKATTSVAAPGEALFGKRGLAAAAEEQPKKKAKKAVKSEKTSTKDELKAAKATLLTFKTLRKGMLLLGCVRQITDGQDLMISLPNKLNGTVALNECSDEFHEFLQAHKKKLQQGEDDEQLQPLSTVFKVGQFVPCVVLATGKADKRKQIHLSLRTSLLHTELSPSSLTKGTSLHATVASVEDHGAIVNLGIRGVHAFVPRKELTTPVHTGQHLLVSVLSMNTHTSTATVTIDRSQVVKAVTRGDSFTLKQLVPGMLLNVRVEDVLENGLSVTFLTFFTATVEQNHMSLPCERGWEESYRKGMKARARIVSIDYIAKQITLSMAPHVVHLQVPESLFSVGDIIEEASIERIDAGIGMLLSLKSKDEDVEMEEASDKKESTTNAKWKAFAPGYVHISNVSDKRVDKLEKKFTVGSSIKCRVLGFSPFDAVASVSCTEHSISQTVLRHKDLKPGTKVNGKILSVESWGILMEISEGVRGLVTPQHMPAFLLNKKANNGKYKAGKTVSARVLHVDLDANKTYLTMKSGLLSSDLPVLSSFKEATMGFIAHGFITKIGQYGVIVTFYNNVYGLVPMAVLQQAGIENLEEAYVLGQVVKARVTRCDANRKRLMLSFDTTSNSSSNKPTAAPETASKLVGTTITKVKITDVETTCFRVQTKDGMEGVLPFVQLTDFPRNTSLVDEIVKRFSAGDVILEPLLVVSQESDGVLTLSKKPLLLEFASRKAIVPRTFADVQENAVLIGYVTSVNVSKGVFVKFLNNLVAVAPKGFLKEQFVAQIDEGMFEIGETVTCSVEKVDKEKKQFVVGFQQSHFLQPTNSTNKARPAYFQAYLREQTSVRNAAEVKKAPFALGKTEKAEFVGVRPYGAVFALEKDEETVTVLVPSVTEKNNEWDEGDSVKLLLTDYDFSKNVYYGAADESLVKSGSKKSRKQKQRVKAGGKIAAATVLAVSPTEKYAVVSFPDPQNVDLLQFGVVQLCDFWCPSQTSSQLGVEVGASIECRVVQSSLKSGSNSTPFDDLVLLALEEEELVAKTKVSSRKSSSKVPKYTQDDLVLGNTLTGVISGISENSMEIRVETHKKAGKVRAMVAIVDVDSIDEKSGHSHPFDRYSVNTTVTGRVIAVTAKGANKLKPVSEENPAKFHDLQLSLRSEDVAGDEKVKDVQRFVRPDWLEGSAGRALLKEGNSVEGVVSDQNADHLTVKLSSNVTGTLSCVEVSEDVDVVRAFQDKFPVGKRVKCFVLQVDDEKKTVDLSVIHSSSAQSKAVVKSGTIVNGVISTKKSAIRPPSIMVQLGAHTFGRVCITELLAKWENDMLELPQFAAGKVVRCVVLSTSNNHIDLSLREDALENPKAYAKKTSKPVERNVGDLVPAVVATTTSSGCFVRVDRHTTSRVMLRDLSDDFVKDPQTQFPSGKLVAGRVTKKSDRGLELSLKASVVSDDVSVFKWSDLKEGLTVKGTITKVQAYGVFVRIEKTTISGLCHISEIADEKVTQPLDQIFSEGDYVKAKVLKVEDRRVSFGLKPSYFEDEESSSEEESDDEEEADSDEEEAEPMDVDEEEAPTKKPVKKSKPVAMEIDLGDDESSSEDEDASSAAPVEFSWDGFSNALNKKTDSKDDDESSSDEEDDEEATNSSKSIKKNRLQSDEWVALREKALASNEEVPQSASDYERLLAVSPQSSYLWIQFMAFHVSLTEIDLARDVAVRATSAVSFRDEKEKLNVWVAYLNLEHDFGDDASFLRVFKSALQVNHPKRVYLHLVDLYARAEEHEDVKQTLATMQKKFRTSKQTWIRSLQYLVGEKQFAEAAETLQRSLKSLAAHKHLPVILKYGQLLYEHGELDKARTIFEGILANYPKRMDLWNVYLDKEIKFGDVALVRALFERLLAMEFSAKKMKFLFKKYLQFEQDQGDEEHVEHVKQLAKDFVASAAAK
ncbi:rRNA biogenesis protein [Phytophthora cactorum]|nr:rRNA biogenesis protein [Phytophthora cactorum]KAG2842130.1 rRNA biogenesis protein [Phytophthora cactorum]KAG2842896.1 rRNA biogenesis protein [Phytophthora cactorum]KAG2952257.1 rRNA biogenesis protein [Phytophthora cactorum]KAG3227960.1 rRNA biogenesis protein [Phytophthora cactorum]